MTSSYNERRENVMEETRKSVEKAHAADRQAKNRAREVQKNKPGFESLSEEAQTLALLKAEDDIMEKRLQAGHDVDSKRVAIIDHEADQLAIIDKEEMENIKAKLGDAAAHAHKRKRVDSGSEEADDESRISKIFHKNMTPLIERLERRIIAGGELLTPGVSTAELDEFTRNASNPADVEAYIKKWNSEDVDLNEGLGDEIEDTDDDIEVVVSSDEEDEDEEDDDIDDFVVNNDLEEDDEDDEDDIEEEEEEEGDDDDDNDEE